MDTKRIVSYVKYALLAVILLMVVVGFLPTVTNPSWWDQFKTWMESPITEMKIWHLIFAMYFVAIIATDSK